MNAFRLVRRLAQDARDVLDRDATCERVHGCDHDHVEQHPRLDIAGQLVVARTDRSARSLGTVFGRRIREALRLLCFVDDLEGVAVMQRAQLLLAVLAEDRLVDCDRQKAELDGDDRSRLSTMTRVAPVDRTLVFLGDRHRAVATTFGAEFVEANFVRHSDSLSRASSYGDSTSLMSVARSEPLPR